MGKIFFNEDPNHFVFTRKMAGYEKITMQQAKDFILQYQGTQITDFFICLGASGAWYDSVKIGNVVEQYDRWIAQGKTDENETNIAVSSVALVKQFIEDYGISLQAVWIDTLREIGIHPWVSIRMNDIHEASAEDSILFSEFFRMNRRKNRVSHRNPAGYYDYALDYLYPEVRNHYLSVIEDALLRFDMYGIELDFMREIYSIGIGREYEGIAVINAFMRDVYKRVKQAEIRLGHPIKIAVRMPDTIEKAHRLGFDILDWVNAGLIDVLVITPRWSSSDNHMPIDIWKKILDGKNITLAAGQEILIDAYNRRGRKYHYNTFETAIATACAHHFQGADAIYLFNYMDSARATDDDNLCANRSLYRKFLCTAGDYDLCADEKRRHVVTYDDVYAVGVPTQKQLPKRLSEGSYDALRIATGKIGADRKVSVILGFEGEDYREQDIEVYLNAKPCRLIGERAPVDQQYTDMRYFAFEAENDGNIAPVCVIEIGLSAGQTVLHWAEIEID